MRVVVVPQLMDNYAYLVTDGIEAAVVDPSEADRVLAAVDREGLKLTAILNTHHHWDHTGGNEDLAAALPGLRVIGCRQDAARIPRITDPVSEGDTIRAGGMEGTLLAVPCHTSGHVAYRFGNALFTGDTLFSAGCGRFFEGTASEMYRALYEVIGKLPDDTEIWCGHEYTRANLRFALSVEPDNEAIRRKMADPREVTVPARLGDEILYNPFLRVTAPGIKASIRAARPEVDVEDPVAVLGALRAMKDAFRAGT